MVYSLRFWSSTQVMSRKIGLALSGGLLVALNYGCVGSVPRSFDVPGSSMEPTLQVDDSLLISPGVYRNAHPQRGDIVTFTPPPPPALGGDPMRQDPWIFRVIGLPGETIEVRDGQTLINEVPLSEPYISEPPTYTFEAVTIPEDAYVVLGDNRNNAFDSTHWGFLPEENIIGRAAFIYSPAGRLGSVYD
ncbi:MAG: signal peptidase I [Leptolyngbya sp. SIOISBB]|nr:signal peptidase I [Leptolyngbya sp. SIOISBB]